MDLLFILVVLFIACIVVSILGTILLFFVQHQKIQNKIFFALACWAFFISYLNAISIPILYMGQQMIAWIFGFLAAIALLIRYAGKQEKRYMTSNILLSASVAASSLGVFLFMQ